jgi:hypothetical protein
MIALLGFTGLAIDGGALYAERRHMQNAADAAALEAARYLCFVSPNRTAAAAAGRAYALAPHNQAQDATVTIPEGDWIATATAWEDATTYFARIFGINSVRVQAVAQAACGPDNKPCDIFPVAFKDTQWAMVKDTCGKVFYVWTSTHDKDAGDDDFAPMCSVCNCDVNDDGLVDEVISQEGRAWLDFTDVSDPLYPDSCAEKNGCGAAELKCWIKGDSPGQIILPACIDGDQGVKAGVQKDIEYRASLGFPGNLARAPIFDGTCGGSKGGCTEKYHVPYMGCIEIVDWVKNVKLDYLDGSKNCWKGKLVKVRVGCACDDYCGGTTGGGPSPSGVNAVSLIQ